jgi:hypothetical protein
MKADVVIALYVAQAMRSFDNLKLLFESAAKGGLIACPAPPANGNEPFYELKKELGIALEGKNCDNGCFIKGVMMALGAHVTCEKTVYDLGQPLDSFEEAIRFISWQIGAEDAMTEIVKKYTDSYVIEADGKFLVPIRRQSCVISFMK